MRHRPSSAAATWLALAALTALAIAVRIAAASSRLTIDDAYSWLVATAPTAHIFLHRLAETENTPPLLYLLLAGLRAGSPFWLRAPAVAAGVLCCPLWFLALRRRLGGAAALLAALGVAVAPLLVTYSDLSRGFTLQDVLLLGCLWAMLALGERETAGRWAAYVLAATAALYTEYDSAIFLVALVAGALWLRRPAAGRTLGLGLAPLLTLLAWLPRLSAAQAAIGHTKLSPAFPRPSPVSLRDLVTSLAFGEHGGTSHGWLRWLLFLALAAVAGVVAWMLGRRLRSGAPALPAERHTVALIAITGGLTLAGHALVAAIGPRVFDARYETVLIALAAALAAAVVCATRSRLLIGACAVALVAVGVGNTIRRAGREFEPSLAPVRAAAQRIGARTVLTNNPVVLFYLPAFRPILDRPYNLGPGLAASCARPCLIVDDTRVRGGQRRRAHGAHFPIGPFRLTVVR